MYDLAGSEATLAAQGAEGHKYTCTQALLIQMLNILLNIQGSFSYPILLSRQMRMSGPTLQLVLNTTCLLSYFQLVVHLGASKESPVSVFFFSNVAGDFVGCSLTTFTGFCV